MLELLCFFNAKLLQKFQIHVYGAAYFEESYATKDAVNLPERDREMVEISLLTKEGLAQAYFDQTLDFSKFHLFSLLLDRDIKKYNEEFVEVKFSGFLAERLRINYLALSNLHKAIMTRQKAILENRHHRPIPMTVLASASKILDLLKPRDKTIIVGFSGGKDSTAAYLALRELQECYGFKLMAVCFDPQFKKFDRQSIVRVADAYNIPLRIISQKVNSDLENMSICVSCARARRQALLNLQPDFLALGHHLQDAAETEIMTGIHNGEFFELRDSYLPRINGQLDQSRVIRPLIYCTQHEIFTYLSRFGVDIPFVSSDAAECEMAEGKQRPSERGEIREYLRRLDDYTWFL